MKIKGSDAQAPLPATDKAGPKAKASASRPAAGADAPAVQLSDLSARLHALESGSKVDSDFDAAKVETIKQAIRDGKFEVNSEVIADKLISSVQELFGKKH